MKKIILVIAILLFTLCPVFADTTSVVQTLGTFKKGECVSLLQAGEGFTSCNITSINDPLSNIFAQDVLMTKRGTEYNYTFCNTNEIGKYLINGFCTNTTEVVVWAYDLEVTPTGFADTYGFYILILILSAGVIIFGFWIRDAPIVILGSFGLYFIGIYILFYGVSGLKDPVYTWAIGIIILMVAGYISIKSGLEMLE